MVDESRFRYRRDAGSNDAGARGVAPRDPREQRPEPGRAQAPRDPATPRGYAAPAADPRLAPPSRAAAPRAAAPSRNPPPAPAASDDPLAELARLIAEQDPFADFDDLPPAPPPRPAAAAPALPRAADPAARPFDPRRDLRAPSRPQAPVDSYDDEPDELPPARPAPARAAVPPRAPSEPAPRRAAPSLPDLSAPPRPQAQPPRPVRPAAGTQASYQQDPYSSATPAPRAALEPPRRPAPQPPSAAAPSRAALVPPRSDAAPIDRSATSVRLGYGSLAHQAQVAATPAQRRGAEDDGFAAPPAPQPRGVAPREAIRDDEDYEPAPRRAAAPEPARAPAEPHPAAYAYSAERRDGDYDEYDEAYDPQYDEDGYMPPHGDEVYEGETRRRKGRAALLLVASVLGLIVAGTAGVFAYRMAVHGSVSGTAGGPPVIRADSTPSKIVAPPAPTPEGQQKMIYDRLGSGGSANERMVPREEQPMDVTTAAIRNGTPAATDPVINSLSTEPKRVRTVPIRADGLGGDASTTAAAPSPGLSALAAYASGQAPGAAPSAVAVPDAKAPPQVARSGDFVVQVASQRSEADAMGSWKALQTRYPNLLSSYVATVKKADLGDRGVYYRAQVGPFATRDQANDLCQALRAQGGDCLVSKN
ncbi:MULTISPECIES: SPOR domain-containing protein [unclassified Xanthobacter]|uniref:SPOR domain-containing protein n=1 Tax=unclassified Xanthobacter TaxID=2623496 RepID=UPI001EDEC064|nr:MULTISPECIES: SPOR domain-containing protein [unclassified Xanthobacter]